MRHPNREANRRTLIRRLSLDLRGLPATIEETRRFLADQRPGAYERLVDRFLDSPQYGERMAIEWLDAARFADTHGYLFDTGRSMHRWRDWTIAAFNKNMPFDQFTVEQLAGDLLPTATVGQRIATGFHRNHIINNEAGANPQEYLVENVIDRVNTTATVWLGLSLGCCQCHDHKYDPFTQEEFYRMYAFFNTIAETGLDGLNSNAKPLISAPTSAQQQELADAEKILNQKREVLQKLGPQIDQDQQKWERTLPPPAAQPAGLMAHWPLDGSGEEQVHPKIGAGVFEGDKAEYTQGVLGSSVEFRGLAYINAGRELNLKRTDKFTMATWVRPSKPLGRFSVVSRMLPADKGFRGYTLQVINGFPALFLIHSFPENMIQVQGKQQLPSGQWSHLTVSYDGSGKAKGVKIYLNGKLQKNGLTIDNLTKSITTDSPFWIGNGHPAAKWQGHLDDVRLYDRPLSKAQIQLLPGLSHESIAATKQRSPELRRRLRQKFLRDHAPPPWRNKYAEVQKLQGAMAARRKAIPTVMVLQEMKKPRPTRVLMRGAFNKLGKVVTAATPATLHPLPADQPRNRLGLARWLVDRRNPLTARVTVNRYWQMYFGTGLVRTSEDFGVQGERPSHPDLLDWLAVEFMTNGWDVKAIQRLIVTSSTYRQSSSAPPESWRLDPQNRLLSRGPRQRLAAELIRDQVLSASGLLVQQIGGPSVKPYQPSGLWREVAFDFSGAALTAQIYKPDKGAALFRRSLYTFWKRTAPPPAMLLLDAPDRERCVVRRQHTNTPLQALLLMNDTTFVEAARQLGQRMMHEGGESTMERIDFAFQSLLNRRPQPAESRPLAALYERQLARFRGDPKQASKLLAVGESGRNSSLDPAELATCTIIASVLFNLDETITKR